MSRLIYLISGLMLSAILCFPVHAATSPEIIPEAELQFANRKIAIFRTPVQGALPEQRVKGMMRRLDQLRENELEMPVTRTPTEYANQRGILFAIGGQAMFIIFEADLDKESGLSLDAVADEVELRLKDAISAVLQQRRGPILLKGILYSTLATAITVVLLIGIQRLTAFFLDRLQLRIQSAREGSKVRWAQHAWLLFQRMTQLVLGFLWLSVAYLWFTFVLSAFPITEPYSDKLSGFLKNLVSLIGHGVISSLPGLLTVAVILFLTKAVNDVVANVFQNVHRGESVIPGVHKDTAHATRRLVAVAIWGFGVAIAYPFLPVAESDAFKGLSVMFGFMLTLGSAGIVTQMMSGLVLVYSRALKIGDFVCIGDVTGVVKESGVLSTKIINMRNEEVTIPNAVLIGSPIKNYTSAGGDKGALISTTVTIGYDTPWRQVHAMLIAAAEETNGLRNIPKPFVMQKALQDFYAEYELYAYVDRPLERIQILSELHSHIQDQFNTHGVQIMSPHFAFQPKNNVLVDRENWYPPPAEKP